MSKIICIFAKLNYKKMGEIFRKMFFKKTTISVYTPERGITLVKISHKIKTLGDKRQVVKIGEKYFRVKELG